MDYTALKTRINAETDPTFVAHRAAGNTAAMADWFNVATTTDAWKPRVTIRELLSSVVWSEFIALSIAKQQAWFALTQGGDQGVDATQARIRQGFVDIFGGASVTVANLSAAAQEKVTRYQLAFTTSGVCSEFGVLVSNEDIVKALAA